MICFVACICYKICYNKNVKQNSLKEGVKKMTKGDIYTKEIITRILEEG